MSYKQRERKRKKTAAMKVSQLEARRAGKSSEWWLTPVRTTTCCARCSGILRAGREMVYRAEPREARCLACAEGLHYRPSVKWEQTRRRAA